MRFGNTQWRLVQQIPDMDCQKGGTRTAAKHRKSNHISSARETELGFEIRRKCIWKWASRRFWSTSLSLPKDRPILSHLLFMKVAMPLKGGMTPRGLRTLANFAWVWAVHWLKASVIIVAICHVSLFPVSTNPFEEMQAALTVTIIATSPMSEPFNLTVQIVSYDSYSDRTICSTSRTLQSERWLDWLPAVVWRKKSTGHDLLISGDPSVLGSSRAWRP